MKHQDIDLIQAITGGNVHLLQALLQRGANPNVADADGNTPLHFAASFNDAQAIRLLLDYGADLSSRNATGFTPLDMCEASSTHVSLVRIDSSSER